MKPEEFSKCTWPESRLADAIGAALAHSGYVQAARTPAVVAAAHVGALASHFGCEAEPIETSYSDLERQFAICAPAILKVPSGYLVAIRSNRRSLRLIAPDLSGWRVSISNVSRVLRAPAEAGRREEVERLLEEAGVPANRREKAVAAILREQLGPTRFTGGWTLRLPAGVKTRAWLGQVGAVRNGLLLATAHTVQYLLWVGSFWIIGQSALAGRMDQGWLLAWALVLASVIPFRLATTWLQGLIAIGVGGLLKYRLLAGALKLQQDEMRQHGIGHFLGQALEAETLETLAINGAIAGLLATIELIVAGVLLGRTAWVLTAWWILTLVLGWRFLKQYRLWTETRMGLTYDVVESMVGHRTRLAQQRREQWHEEEDSKLENYIKVSKGLDRSGAWLIGASPRGWLLLGLASMTPGFVTTQSASVDVAIALAATLFAFTAFRRLTGSLSDIAAAWVAWIQVAPLYHAASRPDLAGSLFTDGRGQSDAIEAEAVTFRYRAQGEPVLRGCTLRANPGDRILLEGPSGGGKSTFAAILSGLRQPGSGVLLAGGLDLKTLGLDGWRKRIAAAPQFHENHIITETLAFNLLLGRGWPPTPDDMQEAAEICEQLGLGDLLERMPGGILQMVGEGGWQLSHGERSRVFIARALLQDAATVILDESFAALDPESLRRALECTLDRARTLLVIAHP